MAGFEDGMLASRPSRRRLLALAAALVAGASLSAFPRDARAEEARLSELLPRLADYAAKFDHMRKNAAATFSAQIDRVDKAGKVDTHSELDVRASARAGDMRTDVLRYTEDGKDKTDEAKKKAQERDEERREKKRKGKEIKEEFKLPFAAGQQPKYDFFLAEADEVHPGRVRIRFAPKNGETAENLYVGEAWVDAKSATVLTMGFKPTKLPFLVSDVNVQLEFGAMTPIGPSVSTIALDGEGGLLFVRKRFRIRAKVADYTFF